MKPKSGTKARPSTLKRRLDAAYAEMLEALCGMSGLHFAAEGRPLKLVVGFSGGCDSTVLLATLAKFKSPRLERIVAVHVHHNLSPNADAWAEHCRVFAEKLGVEFVLRRVVFAKNGDGVEAAARKARYRVLEETAERLGCDAIVTAHHQDDQLETFLIQWARGAGVEGLIGMPPIMKVGTKVALARPMLSFCCKEIEAYAVKRKFDWVEDESNSDTAYLRNAIRHKILPVFDENRSGWREAGARSIGILAEAETILQEVAQEDLKKCLTSQGALNLSAFLSLSIARQARVLRQWMQDKGFETLPHARLSEVLRQVRESSSNSILLYRSQDLELRLYGERILVTKAEKTDGSEQTFLWKGEERIHVPSFNGDLIFEKSEEGFSEKYLREVPLTVKKRSGGEKIKIHRFRPSRSLKQYFTAAGIPEYERSSLPLVWRDKDLIFVAGIGEEVRAKLDDDEGDRYSIRWEKAPSLL